MNNPPTAVGGIAPTTSARMTRPTHDRDITIMVRRDLTIMLGAVGKEVRAMG